MCRNGSLGYSTHTDRISSEDPRSAHLGRRFKVWSGEEHIDAFSERHIQFSRFLFRQFLQTRGIDVRHIIKTGTELGYILSLQRPVSEQTDMIGDQHQIAGLPVHVDTSGGIGHDKFFSAKQADRPVRIGHFFHGVAFITVKATLHDRHIPSAQLSEHKAAFVVRCRTCLEIGDLIIRHINRILHLIRHKPETGSECDQNFGYKPVEPARDDLLAVYVIVIFKSHGISSFGIL